MQEILLSFNSTKDIDPKELLKQIDRLLNDGDGTITHFDKGEIAWKIQNKTTVI